MPVDFAAAVESVYSSDWGRIMATLISLLGDFDLAEESAQEAFAAALDQWPRYGVPEFPRAWIISTARHKAIDRLRRQTLFAEKVEPQLAREISSVVEPPEIGADDIPDERLRLIFTCCHPALSMEAQVALTLRTLCGLETDEIARAFLVPKETMAQRLVRAKRKIRDAGIPYVVPELKDMPARLGAVLTTVYLVFNEGYVATRGAALVRTDLCAEAIRLGELITALIQPQVPTEATGLLALMLLHDARREARLDSAGDLVVLEEQDRRLWKRDQIQRALPLVEQAMKAGPGAFTIQAAISAVHCRAAKAEETDWNEIVRLYDLLDEVEPSPIVSLNRAVALAMAAGPQAGLTEIESLARDGNLENYHLLHAARADLLRRLGSNAAAVNSYRRALALVSNESERRYLNKRLKSLEMA
jgi:RNA polymerase sigma-70 factor (ECF subfamily)